ncbi:18398_t:CDS:2, partial [Acaulospora morrowiae]
MLPWFDDFDVSLCSFVDSGVLKGLSLQWLSLLPTLLKVHH